ncbi:hypothetical protein [Paenibacillus mendelii]|uniref:Uncharacterized protein n=1 Tax=Paenibacillus mendelii TaxID=206163 RepID=A0ABV6JBT5_9BACL|nr:hypothetical protein [Paenibacillus mendelii]MCQ6562621.1 hypothetical protein [Paenibacillus mendelii]
MNAGTKLALDGLGIDGAYVSSLYAKRGVNDRVSAANVARDVRLLQI